MEDLKMYIGGKWTPGHSGERIEVENPATKEIIGTVPRGNEEDVDAAAEAAKEGYQVWKTYSVRERTRCLRRLADDLDRHAEEIADTITRELGAPVSMAKDWHVAAAGSETRCFADWAEMLSYEEQKDGYILRREPFGIVAAVTPWNFPLDQALLKVLPALAAGNCVILKPSQLTPMTACRLAECIDRCGFPAGVFNLVTGKGAEVGNALAGHPDIRMISFTGSTSAGREVARRALSNIKKCTLELGGKSAGIVLNSADFSLAADVMLEDCFMNTGQICNAMTRMLVPASGKEEMEKLLVEKAEKFKVGDPMDKNTVVGPLVSKKAFESVKRYIETGVREKARMLVGEIPQECENGYYVNPVIFTDVTSQMTIAREEIFGPVLSVIFYDTVEEAIRIANDSSYGLCGGVFGEEKEALNAARLMETGVVRINGAEIPSGAPFGGYKESGIGRENCIQSIDEFMEVKSIVI